MTGRVIFSADVLESTWSEALDERVHYGPKGAMLAVLPRQWTLPFALIPADMVANIKDRSDVFTDEVLEQFRSLALSNGNIIVRSSVIEESIWDRGTYESVVATADATNFGVRFYDAARRVIASANGRPLGLVIQCHIVARSRGEFGNLLRISKTRDQWELSVEQGASISRARLNTQRDEAASDKAPLRIRAGQARERLFGSIGAWANSYLTRGRSQRLNCEWITDNQVVYLVQIDEEDEDFSGINPFQLRISPAHSPGSAQGRYVSYPDKSALGQWDKLKVLEELWEEQALHKPMLFYGPLSLLPRTGDASGLADLERDFSKLIGNDGIVVRTSVRTSAEKLTNLPRTESVTPAEAARWCLEHRDKFQASGMKVEDFAFVAHRFLDARASAWIRADPQNPVVEIHGLWGLPDALQYCPYDIWDVHLPTEVATEYPEYKSNILIPSGNGGWEYVRVKNELARSLCISRKDAVDLANRSATIAHRLGRACHIMWFVGCVDDSGKHFSIPWYWTEAHDAEKNVDRANYKVVVVSDRTSLDRFVKMEGSRLRQAIEFKPTDQTLMRDTPFIEAVGQAAMLADVPVILAGSTLAHAYYQLRRQGCTVVASGEKEYSRIRRTVDFGKLVRDKIPERIAQRQEIEITQTVPPQIMKGFLTGKLLEEALEVRTAETLGAKEIELGDLYEVVRGLAAAEGITQERVIERADEKRKKVGGFDRGIVLMQTGIAGREPATQESEGMTAQVLGNRLAGDTFEIPFSFFGFMELDQPRSLVFDDLGVRLDIVLKADRLQLQLSQQSEQLELPLDLSVPSLPDQLSAKKAPEKSPKSKRQT
jgi:predicted house-cleaning noncanonical NTP pyrophosphatase (MazG superfamily)